MKIVVPVKLVPDLVEELTIEASGKALDTEFLRLKLNEFDDHAIEQAILLKERHGCHVSVLVTDLEGADEVLYTAAAKGCDCLIKLMGNFREEVNNHALARLFAAIIQDLKPNLILTGVQAHNDLDGSLGPLLAETMGLPYIGYVAGVTLPNQENARLRKEYPGGLIGEMEVRLPAVLGIQAADEPIRYVAFSKIRQAMKSANLEEQWVGEIVLSGGPRIDRLFQPESGSRAEMIPGDADEVAARLMDIFTAAGVI